MARHSFVVAAAMASIVASGCLGAGEATAAAVARAEVRGVADRALRLEIQQAIGQAPASAASRIEARRRAQEAADKAIVVLRSQGYYDYVVEPDIGEGDAPQPFVTITPGPRSKITQADIEWVGPPPDLATAAAAKAAMSLLPGGPGRAADVLAAEGRVVAAVQKHGYADADAEPRQVIVDHADHSVHPTYKINVGAKVLLGGVKLRGSGRTDPRWVARLASWRAGQAYRPAAIAELERRLLETGVYDSVNVTLAPTADTENGRRPVIVSLVDRPKGTLELGGSYSTSEGAGVDSRWLLYNRLGRADTLTNTFRIGQIDSRLQTELALPDLGKPQQTLKLTAALYRDNTPAYDDTGLGVSADLTHRYGKTSFLTYGLSLDATDTTENEQANFVTLSKDRRLATAGALLAFALDKSNDPLDPTSGWRLDARLQPTASFGDGSIVYLKVSSQASFYLPLDKSDATVVAARIRLGAILGGNIPLVPAQDRFYAGGGGSVRGYAYQAVGPRYPDNTPEGGLSLFETSLEVRQRLTQQWSVAAFVDAGAVGSRITPDFNRPDAGIGVGVRYNAGFGPIRIDIATPLSRRQGDSIVQVYLSIGQSF